MPSCERIPLQPDLCCRTINETDSTSLSNCHRTILRLSSVASIFSWVTACEAVSISCPVMCRRPVSLRNTALSIARDLLDDLAARDQQPLVAGGEAVGFDSGSSVGVVHGLGL